MLEKGIQHHLTLPKSLNIIKALNEMLDGDQTFIQYRFADRRHRHHVKLPQVHISLPIQDAGSTL